MSLSCHMCSQSIAITCSFLLYIILRSWRIGLPNCNRKSVIYVKSYISRYHLMLFIVHWIIVIEHNTKIILFCKCRYSRIWCFVHLCFPSVYILQTSWWLEIEESPMNNVPGGTDFVFVSEYNVASREYICWQ